MCNVKVVRFLNGKWLIQVFTDRKRTIYEHTRLKNINKPLFNVLVTPEEMQKLFPLE